MEKARQGENLKKPFTLLDIVNLGLTFYGAYLSLQSGSRINSSTQNQLPPLEISPQASVVKSSFSDQEEEQEQRAIATFDYTDIPQ